MRLKTCHLGWLEVGADDDLTTGAELLRGVKGSEPRSDLAHGFFANIDLLFRV